MKKILVVLLMLLFPLAQNLNAQETSRSAKTGKYVTKKYATSHKSTTYTSKAKKTKSK